MSPWVRLGGDVVWLVVFFVTSTHKIGVTRSSSIVV